MDDKTKGIGAERTSGRSDEYISGREALDTDGRIGERGTSRIPSRTAGTGSSDATRNLSTEAPTEERTREIRAEIEQTRGEMSETVNAIQDRLRPGNIASNAAESVKNSVKEVTSDTAQVVADRARDVADRARDMADSEPVQYVRANPVPAAMIGIGIAGLTWLMFGGRESRPQNRYRSGRNSRDWRRLAPYNEGGRYYRGGTGRAGYTGQSGYTAESGFGDAGFGEVEYPAQGSYETAAAYDAELNENREYPRSGWDFRREYGGDYGRDREFANRASSWAGQTGSELSRKAQDAARRAQHTTAVAQRKVQRAWQQNPLMMGAASAALGLMVGLAIPETEIENEYMGETRDNAIEGVQQSVRDTVQRVQDAASSAVGLVSGEDQKQSGSKGQSSGLQGQQPGQWGATAGQQPGAGSSGAASAKPESPGNRPSQSGSQGQASRTTNQPPKNTGNT